MTRRIREFLTIFVVLACLAALVVAAVGADTESSVRAETNDGGAWLVDRSAGVVGHVNRTAGEVTGLLRVGSVGAALDVEQAEHVVVAHDDDRSEVHLVDPRTFQIVNTVSIPPGVETVAVDDGVVFWQASPLRVWSLDRLDVAGITSLDERTPTIELEGAGLVTTTVSGRLLVVDRAGGRIARLDTHPTPDPATVEWTDIGTTVGSMTDLSAVGDDAVGLVDGGIVRIPADAAEPADVVTRSFPPVDHPNDELSPALMQPSPAGTEFIVVRPDGVVFSDAVAGATEDALGERPPLGSGAPIAPVSHDDCTFNVATAPPTFVRTCDGVVDQTEPLVGADPAALRIRLVNGWVWINDLTSGTLWIAGSDGELERIDDWGTTLGTDGDDPEQESTNNADDGQSEENPDVGEIRDPEIDEDGVNEPPIARDDAGRTRADLPVVLDVVANDEDADGDALMVTDITGVPEGIVATTTADRGSIQVIPPPGFTGTIDFGYTVGDGRGASDDAAVTVEVVDSDANNQAPTATTDIAEVRRGKSASFNVINNDADPDGDTFVLSKVEGDDGQIIFDPSGEVTFTPDPAAPEGTIELTYEITDAFGATATGTVRVAIRLDTSNNEPRAANDSATTVTGTPVVLNALQNDTDPDNDPLSIAGLPQLVADAGHPEAASEATLTNDGDFFFLPTAPGDYVFLYAVIDGSERDSAYIRVLVEDPTENRPPTAVRDDVTIARGDTRNVYVLENDTDPDNDVVGLVGWTAGDGIEIEQVLGFAFRVTVLPGAPTTTSFDYSISDGTSDPTTGTVVVAVSDTDTPDQPPVARADVVEVRPGQTASSRVLVNDYDPEGGTLRVVSVSDIAGADLRIGPGGQEVFVSVDPATTSSFTFGYDVADEGGNQVGSVVQVRLVPPDESNRPPIARPDVARTTAGNAIDIPVLTNDSDPDGDAIQVESIAAQPILGSAEPQPDGSIRYTPRPGRSGSDRFRYTVVDANGERSVGDVVIGVFAPDGENRPPTGSNDTYTIIAGSDTQAFDVLQNDSDPDGDPLVVTDLAASDPGVTLKDDGSVRFTPPTVLAGASREVTFDYTISDGRGGTDDALVTIEVVDSAIPIAPIAIDDLVGPVTSGTQVVVDLLANDSDPDGRIADLRVDLVVAVDAGAGAAGPAVEIDDAGIATVTTTDRTQHFEYTITDVDGLIGTGQVTVIVLDNVAPEVALLDTETPAATPITLDLAAQSSDADGDPLSFACCQEVQGGSAVLVESSTDVLTVEFTPDAGFVGVGGLSYVVDDQNGHSVSGAVDVTVLAPENSPPVASDGAVEVEAGVPTPVSLAQFVVDPDQDTGDVLSFSIDPSDAPVTLDGAAVVIAPGIDAAGDVGTIGYTVTDSAGLSASATLTFTVIESTVAPPVAVADVATTDQDVGVSIPVLANDIDPLGSGLTIVGANVGDGSGTAAVTASEITYQPNPGYFGATSFTYDITDARGVESAVSTGTVAVTVVGRPGTPSRPQATASNATATVTWALPPANGAALDAVELQTVGGGVIPLGVVSSSTLNSLVNGQGYQFQVRAHNVAGWGEWSEPSLAVTPDVVPEAPSTPSVIAGDGQLRVTWNPPANQGSAIIAYEITIGGSGEPPRERGAAETSYVWDGLTNGRNYQFTIVAINAKGRSASSPPSAAEHPYREPSAPGAPTAQRGNRYVDLAWPAAGNNGDPITDYQVEIASNPGVWVPTGADTSYRWTDLPNGVVQQFRVRASNRDPDPGAPSALSNAIVPCTVPDRANAPSATRSDQSAQVTYADPGDQGCAIEQIQVRASGGAEQTATANPYTFSGLSNGTAYTFQVRARNEEGWGEWSADSAAVTPAGLPSAPGSTSATPREVGGIRVDHGASNANGSAIVRYEVSIDNGAPRDVGTATGHDINGLSNSTNYAVKVRACNDVGCGSWGPSAQVRTNGPPEVPKAPSASAKNGEISASWSAPAGNGLGVDSYDVEHDRGGRVNGTTATSRSWNVANGQAYRVHVRACNEAGCSAWSPWSQSVTPEAPPPPVDVNARYNGKAIGVDPGCTSSRCSWVSVSATGLTPNTTYFVECHDSGGSSGFSGSNITSNGAGTLTSPRTCIFGYDRNMWVTVGPYRSNTLGAP